MAILAIILTITTTNQLTGFQPPRLPSAPPPSYQQAVQQALADAFHHAFLSGLSNAYFLTFLVAAAASIIALFLPGWPFGWQKAAAAAALAEREGEPSAMEEPATAASAAADIPGAG